MRIVCQKCSAAYAIDDKFVTEKGVRAQCPRCRHLQMVKKGDDAQAAAASVAPAAPAPAPGAASPFLFDLPGGAPPAPKPAAAGSPFDFDFGAPPPPRAPAAPPPAPPPFAPPPPAPAPAPLTAPATRSPFDFDLVAPPAPPPVSGAGAPASPALAAFPGPSPMAALPDFPRAPPAYAEPPGFEFGAPPPGAPSATSELDALTGGATPAATGTKCKSCGKAISDPFDIALGTCDDCRSKQQERVDGPTPDSNAGKSERIDVAQINASVAKSAPNLPPVASTQPPAPPPMTVAQTNAVRTAMRETADSNRSRTLIGLLAVVLVVGGIVGLLVWKKPWVRRPPRVTTTTGPASSKAIDAIVQKWKLNYPELADEDGDQAKAHVETGESHLARDTTAGYREAEEEFEKALVLDSSSDRAIAGWVLAVAFGRGGNVDELTSKAADSMLTAAEQRSGAPMLYVAHAHLDIARGVNVNDVQHRAEIGKNSKDPRDKALAMLALGQAQLLKNAQVAEQSFKEALALDPKLKRAYLFQANLAMSIGKYREASDALEKRLSLDPDQWEASETLARLDVEVGELTKARKVLEDAKAAAPKNVRPRILLGMLAYQHQADLAQATELLAGVVADPDVNKKDQADALTHLAIVQRLQGDLDKAKDTLDQALEAQPDLLSARVQQVLVLTDKGVASQARLTMDSLKGKLPGALETALEGRLLVLENRLPEAISSLVALADKDPSQTGALLLAGAAAAKSRKDGKAWELCLKRGLRSDPLSNPLQGLSHLYVRQADLLKPAVGAWANLASGGDEDPNPFLCEGLVAWFSEDLPGADKSFARVTSIDPRSADGFGMRSFVALKRKDLGTAVTQGGKAVGANKTHGLARAALAAALMAANKVDAAKIEAVEANKLAPTLLMPRVVMGDAEARQKNPEQARRLLTGVLLADPAYREAKRALFKQGL
ncbi:MAG: zinc-ribbon domain-containing protein [Myxococcaceae bacterium]|nr:zinc-ribbon domain-containing protein [Myxococcaceae bacterium]